MTISLTTRLGLHRWSADTDPWDRADFDADNAALEAKVIIGSQGAEAGKPVAGVERRLYLATDTERLFLDDADEWHELALRTSPSTQTFVSNVISPNWAITTPNAPGTAAPTTGAHVVGERVWNTAPAAGGTLGWICVTAGTPGTWKTFGTISA